MLPIERDDLGDEEQVAAVGQTSQTPRSSGPPEGLLKPPTSRSSAALTRTVPVHTMAQLSSSFTGLVSLIGLPLVKARSKIWREVSPLP